MSALEKFKLSIVLLGVGGLLFVLFGDSFVVLLARTLVVLEAMLWERLWPKPPPHDFWPPDR